MRVTVTGGNGFLGRHLVNELTSRGHQVYAPSHSEADLSIAIDREYLLSRPADVVIHAAAAVGGIGANVVHQGNFFYSNLIMGAELMELARKRKVSKFLTVGTACEYGQEARVPLKEEDLWSGYPAEDTAPYGLAKRALLEMGLAYRKQYSFNTVHVIPTNLYGPGDNFDRRTSHVVPAIIRKFVEADNQKVTLWGNNGSATRDFLYVKDAARGIVDVLENYNEPEPVNIGSGVETSVAEVARLVGAILGSDSPVSWDSGSPEGTPRRVLDISRIEALVGWHPCTRLATGLRETIDWYMGGRISS